MLSEIVYSAFSPRFWKGFRHLLVPAVLLVAVTESVNYLTYSLFGIAYPVEGFGNHHEGPALLISGILGVPVWAYLSLVLIDASNRIGPNEEVGLRTLFQKSNTKILNSMVVNLLFIPVALPLTFFGAALPLLTANTWLLVAWSLFTVVSLYVLWKLSFSMYLIELEGEAAWASITKSWKMTNRHWWALFGATILLILIFSLVVSIPVTVVSRLLHVNDTAIFQVLFGVLIYTTFTYGFLVAYRRVKEEQKVPPGL